MRNQLNEECNYIPLQAEECRILRDLKDEEITAPVVVLRFQKELLGFLLEAVESRRILAPSGVSIPRWLKTQSTELVIKNLSSPSLTSLFL